MRKLSITTKITIWYVIFLVLITAGFLTIMAYTGNIRANELAKTKLVESVTDVREEISSVGENFIIDDDLDFYQDGVYVSVYDENGDLIEGRRPAEIVDFPMLKDKGVEKITDKEGNVWYVYDSKFDLEGNFVWVRGIVKNFAEQSTFSFMLKIAALAFPILVMLAILGGYIITRRAFYPIRKIIETAEEISLDGDLSKRIELQETKEDKEAKDEIYNLAYTFNSMFDRLEKSFEKEKQFTSDVSHELRTPLTVIISQSEYAKEDEEYRQQALEVINREAKRMSGLVNRLLMIARSDSGRLKLNREKLNFSEMCEAVAEQQKAIAEIKGIEISKDIQSDIYVNGDESMLIRVLLNLTDNSIKYGKENGHIKFILKSEDGFAKLSIKDDGIGIAHENLDKIWERFYRVDSSRSQEGTGLGLSMVQALVKAHDGRIKVNSILGEGSCFDVYIPLEEGKNIAREDKR